MKFTWTGLFAEALTTFQPDGALDLVAFQLQIEAMIQAGVDGIVVAGDWGEGDTLTAIEKYRLLVAATDQARVRVPIVLGVMEPHFPAGVAFVREADTAGADGFLLYPPSGRHVNEDDILKFYQAVTTATALPTMLMETPQVLMKQRFLMSLEGIPQIKAVAEQGRTVSSVNGRFKVFAGPSTSPAARITSGADGWLAGATTTFPLVARTLYEFAQNGDPDVQKVEDWFNLLLGQTAYPAGVQIAKTMRAALGLGNAHVRPPRSPLPEEQNALVQQLARDMQASLPVRI